MIVLKNKKTFGTIGGGNLEYKVIDDAISVIENNIPQNFEHHLVQDHQMCCGGSVTIYIEPVMKPKKLYVFGAGHIGKHVVRYTMPLDFQIHLIDERKPILETLQDPGIAVYNTNHSNFLSQMSFQDEPFIVICTHLHEYDREILAHCIRKPFAYLGMIGSKRKVAVTKKIFLKNQTATEADLAKVDMPMGFDIGGSSPAEIAVSIVAKLIAVKNNRNQGLPLMNSRSTANEEIKLEYNDAKTDSHSNRCW